MLSDCTDIDRARIDHIQRTVTVKMFNVKERENLSAARGAAEWPRFANWPLILDSFLGLKNLKAYVFTVIVKSNIDRARHTTINFV
jgi:hypothetical protein